MRCRVLLGLGCWLTASALEAGDPAPRPAVVRADRVNVRARAATSSEVITQLNSGDRVLVIDRFAARAVAAGEPTGWYRIVLPAHATAWVHGDYLNSSNNTVRVQRLNVRAGPGENHEVIARLARGTAVQPLRRAEDWVEIHPPAEARAYVAAQFLEVAEVEPTPTGTGPDPAPSASSFPSPTSKPGSPGKTPASAGSAPAAGTTPVATAAAVRPEARASSAAPRSPTNPPPPLTAAPPAGAGEPVVRYEPRKPRIIRREGWVCGTASIQAPTSFELRGTDTGKPLNYLLPGWREQRIDRYRGQRVVVTGEELIDPRWPNTPMIEVLKIQLAP